MRRPPPGIRHDDDRRHEAGKVSAGKAQPHEDRRRSEDRQPRKPPPSGNVRRVEAGRGGRTPTPTRSRTPTRGQRAIHPGDAGGTDCMGAAELLTTVVQATAELAEIGLTAGARALRIAVSRLPRP